LFVCITSLIEGSGSGYKAGEAFLQTNDEIESWVIRSSIVETGQAWFDELSQEYSISSMRSVDISCQNNMNFYHIIFDITFEVIDLINDFNIQQEVLETWPVVIPEYYQDPNDPGFEFQWGMGKIDITSAWEYESGNSSVLIGILDSGADVYDIENQQSTVHPDLLQNLWNENGLFGLNALDPGVSPIDHLGHGTHVSGIAGCVTNNNIGISGVAGGGFNNDDGATLLIVKTGIHQTIPPEETYSESICQALNPDGDWNTDDWVDIINMSWGLQWPYAMPLPDEWGGTVFPLLRSVIQNAANSGVILIAAVGNGNMDFTQTHTNPIWWPYPAGFSEVIGVAASNFIDEKYVQSNMGTFIEIAAPGGSGQPYDNNDIISTYPRYSFTIQQQYPYLSNYYGYLSGTSMAAPYVAGLAGLILSRFPSYTASDVRNLIRNSAEEIGPYSYSNGWNKYFGYGRINAGYAIAPPSTPSNFYGTGHINQSPTLHWNYCSRIRY